jgi:hyperosmotically inducible periplasmic protein
MTMNTPYRMALVAAGVVLAAAMLTACDREQVNQAKADVKQAASDVKQSVSQASKEVTQNVKDAAKSPAIADGAITASINADFLKDPDLSVLKIDVDTKDGVVTLNGLAGNSAARQRAERLASAIKGVKEVRNHLTVKQG